MRPSWTLVSSVFSLRMVGDWPGVTPPHNGFTRPRWARETDRERDGKRVEGCQKERNWTRKREERSQRRERERESKSERSGASERMKDRERREGRGQRKPYWFPYVSPYCYYSARWGREEKAGTTLVNHPARQPPLDNHPPRSQLPCVFRSSNRWSSDERETMDDGRAFPSGLSFLSLVSFFLPCSSLFLLSSVVLLFFPFPLLLPSSPSFFPPPPLHPGISRIENIGQCTTRFLRSFPTSNTESYCERWEVYTISKSHKRFAIRLCLNDASSGSVHSRDAVRAWLNISLLMSKHP